MHALGPKADRAHVHLASGKWQRVRHVSRVRRGDRWVDSWTQECVAPPPLQFGRGFVFAPLMAASNLDPVTAGTNDNDVRAYGANYTTVRNATSGTLSSISLSYWSVGQFWNGVTYGIYRAMTPFDATGLPDICDIVTAHIHLNCTGPVNYFGDTVHQVSYDGSNPMGTADYNNFGAVSRGSVSMVPTGAYVLTLTDFQDISRTAISCLGFKAGKDISATPPTSTEYLMITSANGTDPALRPVLDISYSTTVEITISTTFKAGTTISRLTNLNISTTFKTSSTASAGYLRLISITIEAVVKFSSRISRLIFLIRAAEVRFRTSIVSVKGLWIKTTDTESSIGEDTEPVSGSWTKKADGTSVWGKKTDGTSAWTKKEEGGPF